MFHARVMPVYGQGPDRRTRTYRKVEGAVMGVKRTVASIRTPGPYLVHWYENGRKVRAIKLVRLLTGWGLKEAKDFVEAINYPPPY